MAHMEGVCDLGLVHGVILPVVTALMRSRLQTTSYLESSMYTYTP